MIKRILKAAALIATLAMALGAGQLQDSRPAPSAPLVADTAPADPQPDVSWNS